MFFRTAKQSVQFDLHTHSDRSWESKVPGRLLLRLARRNGLRGIGICERDAFPDESLYPVAEKLRLRLALGIEFTCTGCDVIGYGMDLSARDRAFLDRRFAHLRDRASRAAGQLARRLAAWDGTVSPDRVAAFSGKPAHPTFILQYLVQERRMFASLAEGRRFLRAEGLDAGLAAPDPLDPAEVIALIHRAGGIAIWTHPQTTPPERQRPLLAELTGAGLDAVEAVYPYREHGYAGEESNEVLQARTLSLTKDADILLSGGSDCKYPVSPLSESRPMLPGEYGITAREAELFGRVLH